VTCPEQRKLQAAILGFAALEPTSGYTLKQRFDGLPGRYAEGVAATRAEYATRLDEPRIFSLAGSPREQRIRLAIEHSLAWCELEWLARARRELTTQRKESMR
jgi:hypothetical protein